MSKAIKKIGIIAEDKSDVESIKVLINRLKKNEKVSYEYFAGKGCGKIKKKCNGWANILSTKGCSVLILLHDLDRNTYDSLYANIESSLLPCPISNYLISIPIEEIESWIIADPNCIKKFYNIKQSFNIKLNPETIESPKEKIEELVWTKTRHERRYLNTEHNPKLLQIAHIPTISQKCQQFNLFQTFIETKI